MNKHLEILKILNIPYKNERLYLEALTHSSYINEHHVNHGDYQRLEFLGDAVVGLTIADYIYRECIHMAEGELTTLRSSLVRRETLAELSKRINLNEYVFIGHGGENEIKENVKFQCDIFEALIGAIYLDLGFDAAHEFVLNQFKPFIKEKGFRYFIEENKDYKSKLQELVQADTKRTVSYEFVDVSGPQNAPIFVYNVLMDDIVLGTGSGSSKKEAQQEAAKDALSKMAK